MAALSSVLKLTLLDQVTGPARRVNAAVSSLNRQTTSMLAPMRGIGGQLLAFGAGYLGVTKGISGTVGAAIEFESAFADVRKVVTASDEQFANMSRTIKAMSRELPLTSVEIAQLFAAAGESGIATNELKAFAEMAGRVGIAFDMGAGEAGESLAKLKSQLGLTVAETGDLADAINHLSNNMASKAKDITAYMLKVGKFAEMGGFAKEQVAAIGSAMISAGAEADTAGTAMMNVVRKMTSGDFAKKDQREAAKALGLDLPTLAKQMQKDAPGALKKVLKAIAKAPKDQQIALLSQFFGDEAKAFSPLVGNIGMLDDALLAVGDRSNYAGSAFKEFVARADTTSNALKILRNKISFVFEGIGEAWLPDIKEGVAAIGGVLDTLGERAGVFDEMKYGLKGFTQGLGFDGGVKEAIESLGDLLFGKVDGDGAADRLGGIFAKFEGYGKSVREFSAAIRDNPVAQFLGEIGAQGFKLMAASVGIALVAGAFMKLARAIAFLTGITTAIGLLKTLGNIGGILGGAAGFPGFDGGQRPPKGGGTSLPPAIPLWTRAATWFKGLGMGATIGAIPQVLSDTPGDTHDDQVKNQAKFKSFLEGMLGLGGNSNGSHPYLNQDNGDGGRAASMDAYLGGPEKMPSGGSPVTVDQLLTGLQGKPLSLDAGTIGQLLQPSRGVQEVRDVNRQQPVVNVHAPVTISNISSPQEAVDAAASQLGQRVKSAVESAYSD